MGSTNNTKVVGEDHQVRGWAYVTQEINPHKTHNKHLSLLSSIFLDEIYCWIVWIPCRLM